MDLGELIKAWQMLNSLGIIFPNPRLQKELGDLMKSSNGVIDITVKDSVVVDNQQLA